MPQRIIREELFFLWAWQQNYCLSFVFPKFVSFQLHHYFWQSQILKLPLFQKCHPNFWQSSPPFRRYLAAGWYLSLFVKSSLSLCSTVSSESLFLFFFFASAICFNCLDKVNGLTNVCVAETLWAIFCPCGGTYYYCTFFWGFFFFQWCLGTGCHTSIRRLWSRQLSELLAEGMTQRMAQLCSVQGCLCQGAGVTVHNGSKCLASVKCQNMLHGGSSSFTYGASDGNCFSGQICMRYDVFRRRVRPVQLLKLRKRAEGGAWIVQIQEYTNNIYP